MVIEFFWLVRNTLLKSQKAVASLMESSNNNVFATKSASLLKPMPIKPKKDTSCNGSVNLDPISFIK
ncbi:unnamed protein product [Absidia cylindrospora]